MYGFLVLLHVLAAVLIIGPAALVPFTGVIAIRRRDVAQIRVAGRRTMFFAFATLLVFGTGMVALTRSTEYSFTTVWVIITVTLYVIAILVGAGILPAALAKAAKTLEDGSKPTVAIPAPQSPDTPRKSTTGSSLSARESLQQTNGRLIALSLLVALLYVAITVLMVLRPFSEAA